MKKHVVFVCLIAWMGTGIAQPVIEWQKCLGGALSENANDISQTTDGGLIITGYALSNNGDVFGNHGAYDFWLVKLNADGSKAWAKTYGGSEYDWPYAVKQTPDGGYVVAGYTKSMDGDVSFNNGDKDCWVIKVNNQGTIEWEHTYGGSYWDEAWDIDITSDNGYIVAGRTISQDGDITHFMGGFDFWVFKLDASGNLVWQRSFGGSLNDIAYSIIQTADGGYIVAGDSNSNDGDTAGQHGSADYWVIKLDADANILWQKMLGGTSLDRANSICETTNGEYVVTGQCSSGNGDVSDNKGGYDYWVVKLSHGGDIIWEKSFGGSNEDFGTSITPTTDGGLILAGTSRSTDGDVTQNVGGNDFWVVKLDASGMLIWEKSYGGTTADWANAIIQTSDGGYAIAGNTVSNDVDVSGNHGNRDFWVVKLSPETSPTQTPQTQTLVLEPNPAGADVRLQIPQDIPTLLVHISDVSGRRIHTINHPNGANLDVSGLPTGFYLISARAPDGRLFVGRLGKE